MLNSKKRGKETIMKKSIFKLMLVLFALISFSCSLYAEELFATVNDIYTKPEVYKGKTVKISGFFSVWKNAPGAPPISRSDWVLCNAEKKGIYCTGSMPCDEETGELLAYWKPIDVTGVVEIKDNDPFIRVIETKPSEPKLEKMVSVRQIILNQHDMLGEYVGLTGVLGKGHGIKGDRMYLVADPTGAIRIGRTSKLYPKGTILHIKGIVSLDEYGMPMIDQVEIVSAKVD